MSKNPSVLHAKKIRRSGVSGLNLHDEFILIWAIAQNPVLRKKKDNTKPLHNKKAHKENRKLQN